MNQSESITKLADALVKAQAEMPEIPMDGVNPHYKSKFSTLGAVISKVRPVFAKHGLVVLQLPSSNTEGIGLTTRIIHTSGEWIEETVTMTVNAGANPGQELGKLVTYFRRYGLSAAAGVYSDEDTDNEKPVKPAKETAPELPTDKRAWSVAQKEALMKAGLAKNDFASKGMLGLSALPVDASVDEIVSWGKVYRKFRETMTATEAADLANNEVFNVS